MTDTILLRRGPHEGGTWKRIMDNYLERRIQMDSQLQQSFSPSLITTQVSLEIKAAMARRVFETGLLTDKDAYSMTLHWMGHYIRENPGKYKSLQTMQRESRTLSEKLSHEVSMGR
jgi:hypothetical protein